MTQAGPDRRQVMLGLAAAGLAAGAPDPLAARATTAPNQRLAGSGTSVPGAFGMQRGLAACRFGALHYRYAQPREDRPGAMPVLCLHASPSSGLSFAQFVPKLARDRLVIAPDNPGFGLSDRPAQAPAIADFARAIWDMVDDLGLGVVALVGTSTGSATAVEMARQRPHAAGALVLHAPPLLTAPEIAAYEKVLEGTVPPDYQTAAQMIPARWDSFAPFREGLSDDVAWQMFWEMNRDPIHRGWGHDAAFAYDFEANLRKLAQPILVLDPADQHDKVTGRAEGLAPGIEMARLPWSGNPFTTRAQDAVEVIAAFLDRTVAV